MKLFSSTTRSVRKLSICVERVDKNVYYISRFKIHEAVTRVQINIGSWKLNESDPHEPETEDPTCDECGKTYHKPILATVASSGNVHTYQACPHCMSRVHAANPPKTEEIKAAILSKQPAEKELQLEGKCGHFFGYLNKRPKGTPVPERCLTCEKMVDCLYG